MATSSPGTPLAAPFAHDDPARPEDVDPCPPGDPDAASLGPDAGGAGQREASAPRPSDAPWFRSEGAALRYSRTLIHGEAAAVRLDDGSWAAVGWASHFEPHERHLYGPQTKGRGALFEKLWPDGTVHR